MTSGRGILDSGIEDEGARTPPRVHVQRYVPSRARSIGTHNIQGGVITSNFTLQSLRDPQEAPPRGCVGCRLCRDRCSTSCNRPATPAWLKSLLVFIWLAMLSLLAGICIFYLILGDVRGMSMTLGDQYVVTNPLLTTFCEAVHVTSNQTFSANRLDRIPGHADTNRMRYNMTYHNISIPGKDYLYNQFRFIKGSNLTMHIYPDKSYLEIIFLKGKHTFESWVDGCKVCYTFYAPVPRCSQWHCPESEHTFHLNINETDDYYYIVNNPFQRNEATVANANIKAEVDRVIYTCNHPKLCNNVSQCEVSFEPFTRQAALVEYLTYDSRHVTSYVSITCCHRVYMYVVWFVLLPLATWVFISIFLCCRPRELSSDGDMELEPGSPQLGHRLQDTVSLDSEMTCTTDTERFPFARTSGSRSWDCSEEAEDSFEVPDELVNHI